MERLPFWTKIGRKLRRMWLSCFKRFLRVAFGESNSRNRSALFGRKKRYRIKSQRKILGQNQRRRYKRKGFNYHFMELFVTSLLCAAVFPFELLGELFRAVKKKISRRRHSNTTRSSSQQESRHSKNASNAASHRSAPTHSVSFQSIEHEATASTIDFTFTTDHFESFVCKMNEKTHDEMCSDENSPKSKPKHPSDQYIRKRMMIAGSYYCEKSVLNKLHLGTYFDIVLEPDNPYDKNAVMLILEGEKIGYIAKSDQSAFVTCLRLNRSIYGVITDVIFEDGRSKYEFEAWFDSCKKDH